MSFFIRNPKGSTLSAFHDLCWLHLNSTNLYFAPCPLHHHSVHFVLLPSGLVMTHHCSPKTPEDLSPMISKHTSVFLDYLAGTSFFKYWTALSLYYLSIWPVFRMQYHSTLSNSDKIFKKNRRISWLFDELLWYWSKFPVFFPAFTIAFFIVALHFWHSSSSDTQPPEWYPTLSSSQPNTQFLWPPLPSSTACQTVESNSGANSSLKPPINNLPTLQQVRYSRICFQDSPPSSCHLPESKKSIQILCLWVSGASCLIVSNPESDQPHPN